MSEEVITFSEKMKAQEKLVAMHNNSKLKGENINMTDRHYIKLKDENLKLHAEIDSTIFLLEQVIKSLKSVTEEKPKVEPLPNHYEKLKKYTEKLFDGVPPE